MTPRVAIDVGSLHGPQTGVGQFVARLLDGLAALDDPPEVLPYVLSFRAELRPGVRRLRYPAGAALRAWGRFDLPRADRALAGADVVHGPNYIVPPSRPSDGGVRPRLLVPPAAPRRQRCRPALRRRPAASRAPGRHRPRPLPAHGRPGARAPGRGAGGRRAARLAHRPASRRSRPPRGPGGDGPTFWPSAPRNRGRTSPAWSTRSGSCSASLPELALVLLGPDGPDQPAIDDAIGRLPALDRRTGPAGRLRERRGPQRHPPRRLGPRLPVAGRGLRLPGPGGHGRRRPRDGRRRRLAAGDLRRGGRPREPSQPVGHGGRAPPHHHRQHGRARSWWPSATSAPSSSRWPVRPRAWTRSTVRWRWKAQPGDRVGRGDRGGPLIGVLSGRGRGGTAAGRPAAGGGAGAAHRARQRGRRHRAARPDHLSRPGHHHLHAGRSGRPRAGLGPDRRDLGGHGRPGTLRVRASYRARGPAPPGSAWATGIWPPTSTAATAWVRAPR